MELISSLAFGVGTAALAGVRLYATVAVLGLVHRMGWYDLPGSLAVLADPWVVGVALALTLVEFLADKIAIVDSIWDALNILRSPVGAGLAAMALADRGPAATVVAGLIGGGFALGAHAAKTGSRAVVNASPEPVSNILVSLLEDLGWAGLIVVLLVAPLIVVAVFALLIALALRKWSQWKTRRSRA